MRMLQRRNLIGGLVGVFLVLCNESYHVSSFSASPLLSRMGTTITLPCDHYLNSSVSKKSLRWLKVEETSQSSFLSMSAQSTSKINEIQKKDGEVDDIDAIFQEEYDVLEANGEVVPSTTFAPAKIQSKSFRKETTIVAVAVAVGALSGLGVSIFKLSIDFIRQLTYGLPFIEMDHNAWSVALIPAIGGLAVSLLRSSENNPPPGLRPQVAEVNAELEKDPKVTAPSLDRSPLSYIRKSMMAICTLGTGCSLGPEGPAVELGMATSRILMGFKELVDRLKITPQEQKLFLACGAAAGVSAGFNAPISAVFFAFEVMQAAFNAESCKEKGIKTTAPESLSSPQSASSILAASVSSALISRAILQDHLTLILSSFSLKSPLVELPLYLLMGALSGVVAFAVGRLSTVVADAFDGKGPTWTKNTVAKIPNFLKPVVGGLVCGVVGLAYPQILFFGYETLNGLLANKAMATTTLLSLLGIKMCTTAISSGSGLVGGTFAPSLFYGAMLGASVHNAAEAVLPYLNSAFGISAGTSIFSISGVPAYTMVGAASTLAALFRAPLTGSLLVFELSHSYDVILPLLTAAGVGSLVNDIFKSKYDARQKRLKLEAKP